MHLADGFIQRGKKAICHRANDIHNVQWMPGLLDSNKLEKRRKCREDNPGITVHNF